VDDIASHYYLSFECLAVEPLSITWN